MTNFVCSSCSGVYEVKSYSRAHNLLLIISSGNHVIRIACLPTMISPYWHQIIYPSNPFSLLVILPTFNQSVCLVPFMETGYLDKSFERVQTEIGSFPDMNIFTFFYHLDEFYPSFQYFTFNFNHFVYSNLCHVPFSNVNIPKQSQ